MHLRHHFLQKQRIDAFLSQELCPEKNPDLPGAIGPQTFPD
jgi:hypothetical protein